MHICVATTSPPCTKWATQATWQARNQYADMHEVCKAEVEETMSPFLTECTLEVLKMTWQRRERRSTILPHSNCRPGSFPYPTCMSKPSYTNSWPAKWAGLTQQEEVRTRVSEWASKGQWMWKWRLSECEWRRVIISYSTYCWKSMFDSITTAKLVFIHIQQTYHAIQSNTRSNAHIHVAHIHTTHSHIRCWSACMTEQKAIHRWKSKYACPVWASCAGAVSAKWIIHFSQSFKPEHNTPQQNWSHCKFLNTISTSLLFLLLDTVVIHTCIYTHNTQVTHAHEWEWVTE